MSQKTGCFDGKTNGMVDTNENFMGKKGQPAKVAFFFHLYRNDWNFLYHLVAPLEPGPDARITSLGGHWPLHLFVPRLLRPSEMDSQMARLIPFPVSSVGNVQYDLSKISHQKFCLTGKLS